MPFDFKKVDYETEEERQQAIDTHIAQGYLFATDHSSADEDIKQIHFVKPADSLKWKKKRAVQSLNRVNRHHIKVFITLIDVLIDKGVISASDISAGDRRTYQELKALWADAGNE